MPKQKSPKSEEAKRSQLRLILAAAGFFVIAVIGSCIALGIEILNSPGFKQMVESAQNSVLTQGSQSDESKEAEFRRKIAAAKAAGNKRELMENEYEYGDWLYTKYRYSEAKDMYADSAALAKAQNAQSWQGPALARVGFAMHKIFALNGIKPDTAPVEEAIKVESGNPKVAEREENIALWTTLLGQLQIDNDNLAQAEKTLSGISQKHMDPEDKAALEVTWAKLYLKKNDRPKALVAIRSAAAKANWSDWEELYTLAKREENADTRALRKKVVALWKDNNYSELDKLAQQLRDSKEESADGLWTLHILYDALASEGEGSDAAAEAALTKCEQWTKQQPLSVTPHIIASRIYREWAWLARGSGWSNTVSQEGWKKFNDRLADGHKELDAMWKLPQSDPFEYTATQAIALGEGMEKPDYQKLVDDGLKKYPNFTDIYTAQAWFLQPRWYGDEGEWDKVAQAECDKLGGTAGDIMYARIVQSLEARYDNVFTDTGADWQRVKRGMEAAQKKYPNAVTLVMNEARLANQAEESGPKQSGATKASKG